MARGMTCFPELLLQPHIFYGSKQRRRELFFVLGQGFGEPGDGPIKTFTLRGIKDSPPYLHDGRLLTLEDTVEFFNIVLQLKLAPQEKQDVVAFMRQL